MTMVNKTFSSKENDVFGWSSKFSGTVYTHIKNEDCRLREDKNKVSLTAKGVSMLETSMIKMFQKQHHSDERETLQQNENTRTDLVKEGGQYRIETFIVDVMVGQLKIKESKSFIRFLQCLHLDAYKKLLAHKYTTFGLGVPILAQPAVTNSSASKIIVGSESVKELERGDMGAQADESTTKSKLYEDEDRELCKICLDSHLQMLIIPCGHYCLCEKCSQSILNGKCPICKGDMDEIVKVFKC